METEELTSKMHEIAAKVSDLLADELDFHIVPALVLLIAVSLCELSDTEEKMEKNIKSINELLRGAIAMVQSIDLEIMQ